jgi:hypothetical protein
MRISGVGWPLAIWLAIDQILRLAPSRSPDMDPVVSSTKATSIVGVAAGGRETIVRELAPIVLA